MTGAKGAKGWFVASAVLVAFAADVIRGEAEKEEGAIFGSSAQLTPPPPPPFTCHPLDAVDETMPIIVIAPQDSLYSEVQNAVHQISARKVRAALAVVETGMGKEDGG